MVASFFITSRHSWLPFEDMPCLPLKVQCTGISKILLQNFRSYFLFFFMCLFDTLFLAEKPRSLQGLWGLPVQAVPWSLRTEANLVPPAYAEESWKDLFFSSRDHRSFHSKLCTTCSSNWPLLRMREGVCCLRTCHQKEIPSPSKPKKQQAFLLTKAHVNRFYELCW